ncbi:MAG: GNAT family N-acetyltransferase [Candidatus Eremiobacteraeota bacterium]|nr:GNAT family N-acetyltransferase [Candidatus Eremiobacteraeota bacterium]
MPSYAPTIETPRLRLRAHRRDDLAPCLALWSDPEVTRFIGQVSSEQQTWARLLTNVGHWALMGFGYWVMELPSSNRFVGEVGFADFHRDIADSMRGVPELGFALTPEFHGHGYATEGARAVLNWADTNLDADRTVCLINERNSASVRVAAKIGYRVFDRAIVKGEPTLLLERSRPTYS